MKKFMLGVLSVFLVQTTINYFYYEAIDKDKDTDLMFDVLEASRGSGVVHVLTERCTKEVGRSGKSRREYFKCNNLQNLASDIIYGE